MDDEKRPIEEMEASDDAVEGASGETEGNEKKVFALKGVVLAIVIIMAVMAIIFGWSNLTRVSGGANAPASNWSTSESTSGSHVGGGNWAGSTAGGTSTDTSKEGKADAATASGGQVAATEMNEMRDEKSDEGASSASTGLDMDADTTLKNGSVEVVTTKYDDTFAAISAFVTDAGGKITSRHDTRGGGWTYYHTGKVEKSEAARQLNMVLRLPNDKVYPFLDALTMLDGVEVERLSVEAEDMTETLEGFSNASNEIDEKIAKLEEQLKEEGLSDSDRKVIESKLSELRREAERLSESKGNLEYDIAMSEIRLQVREKVNPTGTDALSGALSSSFDSFVSVMSFALAIVVWVLPYLLLIALVCVIVWAVRRRGGEKGGKDGEKRE